MERLKNEYIINKNLSDPIKNNKILFEEWLREKQKIMCYYEQFIETMDFIPQRGVVEFNKNYYDSILPYLPLDSIGIAVSKEFKNLDKNNKRVVGVNGTISTQDKYAILKYNNKEKKLDFINNYITEFGTYPFDIEVIKILEKIININKNVFIGVCGNENDFDKDLKLNQLYYLKKDLEIYTGKYIESELVTTNNGYYMAAITPKLKYKKRL